MNNTRYHIHVTADSNTVPKGWKRTNIILKHGLRQQTDVMFTKHYYNSGSIEDYLNDAYNTFPSNTRVKLEQDNNFTKPISVINYLEIHVKVVFTGHCPLGTYWVRSTNPKDIHINGNEVFFFNKRIYTGDINEETELARLETAGMHILDFKVEQVIFDSNRQTDSWWT